MANEWTAAVAGTYVSATLSSLSRSVTRLTVEYRFHVRAVENFHVLTRTNAASIDGYDVVLFADVLLDSLDIVGSPPTALLPGLGLTLTLRVCEVVVAALILRTASHVRPEKRSS